VRYCTSVNNLPEGVSQRASSTEKGLEASTLNSKWTMHACTHARTLPGCLCARHHVAGHRVSTRTFSFPLFCTRVFLRVRCTIARGRWQAKVILLLLVVVPSTQQGSRLSVDRGCTLDAHVYGCHQTASKQRQRRVQDKGDGIECYASSGTPIACGAGGHQCEPRQQDLQ